MKTKFEWETQLLVSILLLFQYFGTNLNVKGIRFSSCQLWIEKIADFLPILSLCMQLTGDEKPQVAKPRQPEFVQHYF